MPTITLFGKSMVSAILILLIFGVAFGVVISGNDILNPQTSQAYANKVDVETENLQNQYKLEQQRNAAETQIYIDQIQLEARTNQVQMENEVIHVQKINALKERLLVMISKFVWYLGLGILATASVSVVAISIGHATKIAQTPTSSTPPLFPYKPVTGEISHWDNQRYRWTMITKARREEQKYRESLMEKADAYFGQNVEKITWESLLGSDGDQLV